MLPYYKSDGNDFVLYRGDCRDIVTNLDGHFDMIFADPPYFLSNGGMSVHSGRAVCVNKGNWDKSNGHAEDSAFNYDWLRICREKLSDAGTIWVCGTFHNMIANAH